MSGGRRMGKIILRLPVKRIMLSHSSFGSGLGKAYYETSSYRQKSKREKRSLRNDFYEIFEVRNGYGLF